MKYLIKCFLVLLTSINIAPFDRANNEIPDTLWMDEHKPIFDMSAPEYGSVRVLNSEHATIYFQWPKSSCCCPVTVASLNDMTDKIFEYGEMTCSVRITSTNLEGTPQFTCCFWLYNTILEPVRFADVLNESWQEIKRITTDIANALSSPISSTPNIGSIPNSDSAIMASEQGFIGASFRKYNYANSKFRVDLLSLDAQYTS
jgi:hypothetical protein